MWKEFICRREIVRSESCVVRSQESQRWIPLSSSIGFYNLKERSSMMSRSSLHIKLIAFIYQTRRLFMISIILFNQHLKTKTTWMLIKDCPRYKLPNTRKTSWSSFSLLFFNSSFFFLSISFLYFSFNSVSSFFISCS